jgi:nucleoside-diphosphate-sugar epimerase
MHSQDNVSTDQLHVIFGAGVLGRTAARELARHGQRVRIISRSGNAGKQPASVEVLKADAYDEAQTRALTQGAYAVYQCAQPEYHLWTTHFPKLQASIASGARQAGARLIVADNLYMYGEAGDQPLSETSPIRPCSAKGTVRAAMAQTVLDMHARGDLRVAIARASDFFGPEDRATTPRVFAPAVAGQVVNLLGRPDTAHTFSYAPDFGRALALLGMCDDALGQVWHVPSAAPVTQREFIALMEAELGKPIKTRYAGRGMLRMLGLFNPTIREVIEMLYQVEQPFVMDDSKFRARFGMQPTPLAQAIRETVLSVRGVQSTAS